MTHRQPPSTLTPVEWNTILLVERYRAVTLDILQSFVPDESCDALRLRAERLRHKGWLRKTWLLDREACYVLGAKAERLCQRHVSKGFPFGSHALLQHLGIALFCVLGRYQRLLPHELAAQFPNCTRPGFPAHSYCLSQRGDGELAWVLVDHASRADRFPPKLFRVVAKRRGLPGLEQLIDERRFRLVIVTATPEKRARIEQAIAARPIDYVPTSVIAIPFLSQFMF